MSSTNIISLAIVLIAINCRPITVGCAVTMEDPKASEEPTLRALYILMRHGIRAPYTTYPLDPFASENPTRFPNGRSQLTDNGIKQSYNVAKLYKKMYNNFLMKNQKQAFLRASAAQRCIDTLSIVAKEIWPVSQTEQKSWPPMIFSLPKQIDSVLWEEPDCKPADDAEQNNLKTKEVQDYEAMPEIQELYNFTAQKTGLPSNMYSVTKAFDCIRCEKENDLQSPAWATPQIYKRMGDVLSKRLNFFYKTTLTQRLRAGPILDDFITKMDNVIKSKPEDKPKNLFIYTTHDFKIASVLNALGDPQLIYPPFAAAIIFELHKIGKKNIIRAKYLDQTTKLPYTTINLNLSKCKAKGRQSSSRILDLSKNLTQAVEELPKLSNISLPTPSGLLEERASECTFKNFVNSVADLRPVDWRTECGLGCTYDPFKVAEANLGST